MKTSARFVLACLAVTIVLITGSMSHAQTDKTVIINQETATFGRGPADPPGFPIVISVSGPYKLGSNIIVPDTNTTAIEITADDVTLDLNGFVIRGSNVCNTGFPATSCSPNGSGFGVRSDRENITVRNGSVRGMGASGVLLTGPGATVERIRASHNGTFGIATNFGIILNNIVFLNSIGLAGSPRNVIGNSAFGNVGFGIQLGQVSAAAHNTTSDNGNNTLNATQTGGNMCGFLLCP